MIINGTVHNFINTAGCTLIIYHLGRFLIRRMKRTSKMIREGLGAISKCFLIDTFIKYQARGVVFLVDIGFTMFSGLLHLSVP